uniref:CMT1A duplicated region transcript 4 n=1 Tax=Rhinolophus ferrumequinum TaxID=59479 RepID=A0A671F165_RHIFE
TDARQMKTDGELTENIGLPLKLLEKHDPWSAYVTYTSPMVRRLIEKSKARELECMKTLEESGWTLKQNKSSSIIQLRRRKSSTTSSNMVFEDTKPMLSVWDAFSVLAPGHIVFPEPVHLQTDSRDCPTANYNKIIFSRKPVMRMLPIAHFC